MTDDHYRLRPASSSPVAPGGLTHVRADGTAHMVDVTEKPETTR